MNQGDIFAKDQKDWIVSGKFDRLALAATPTNTGNKLVFFQHTQAVDGVEVTNMSKAGELPPPENLIVQALKLVFVGCAIADIESFYKAFTVRLIVGNKDYTDQPAFVFGAGGGVTTGSTTYGQNGATDARAVYSFGQYPVPIASQVPFRVECVGTGYAPTAAMTVYAVLDGLYKRGVQ